jgi:hypothetical protein
MTKNITTRQFRELIDIPLPGFKGTKAEYKKLVKSLLIPPEINKEWAKDKAGNWVRV